MDLLDKFYEDLDEEPSNWGLRGTMADWLFDDGQTQRAACVLWMIKNQKRPNTTKSGEALWFNNDTINKGLGDPASDLPGAIYKRLQGEEIAHHKKYPTLREAEEDFMRAWCLACADGWNPDSE